ncbi:MAG: hypothetical protein Q7K16_04000 [Candidatus Azambacteria bacterium]|nr:hypothetical protein [Candidatus Azambacteria bacterium]
MTKFLSEPSLDAIFDSQIRARILKLFLYSPDKNFDFETIKKMLNVSSAVINKQFKSLLAVKFIIAKNVGGKKFFKVNGNFDFYDELKELIAKASPASKEKMLERLKGLGKIKLAVISGIFINSDTSRADLLVVGDGIKQSKFNNFLKALEAEVGKEVNYALMTTKEFKYRYDMYDRFVHDLLDFKHEKLINKLKI